MLTLSFGRWPLTRIAFDAPRVAKNVGIFKFTMRVFTACTSAKSSSISFRGDILNLSELGESFIPILNAMMDWSQTHLCPDYENPYINQEQVYKNHKQYDIMFMH